MPDLIGTLPQGFGSPQGLGSLAKGIPGLESLGGLTSSLTPGDKPGTSIPGTVTTGSEPAEEAPKEACNLGRKWKRHGPCDDD